MWSIIRNARLRALPVITSSKHGFCTREISSRKLELARFNGLASSARFMSHFTPHSSPEINAPSSGQVSDSPWHDSFAVDETDVPETGVFPDQLPIETTVMSLQDLGLGSWTSPVGILQITLDTLHTAGLPWWAAIATSTLALRALTFPLYLRTQRATPEHLKRMAAVQEMMEKLGELQKTGTAGELERAKEEAKTQFQRDYPRASMRMFHGFILPSFVQGSIFVSFFLALRGMADAPVASMQQGGALWFPDLTVMDPYYLLPAITCVTLVAIIEVGADMPIRADQMPQTKIILRMMPFVMFLVIMKFPAATLSYWMTANLISLGQAVILKNPKLRKTLNLPPLSAMRGPPLGSTKVLAPGTRHRLCLSGDAVDLRPSSGSASQVSASAACPYETGGFLEAAVHAPEGLEQGWATFCDPGANSGATDRAGASH